MGSTAAANWIRAPGQWILYVVLPWQLLDRRKNNKKFETHDEKDVKKTLWWFATFSLFVVVRLYQQQVRKDGAKEK